MSPQGSFCACPANERQCYNVTSSLIGWAHTQHAPCTNHCWLCDLLVTFQKVLENYAYNHSGDSPVTFFKFNGYWDFQITVLDHQQAHWWLHRIRHVFFEVSHKSFMDHTAVFNGKWELPHKLYDCMKLTYLISCLSSNKMYHQTSNIKCTLVSNKLIDHSDVVGAPPVGAAPTTSWFST